MSSQEAIALLKELIAIPSLSREEKGTADLLDHFLTAKGCKVVRYDNNVLDHSAEWVQEKPTVLLCSHHDTVRANSGYTRDPHLPEIIDGKLYGLGANDAGGCLVSLIAAFLQHEKSNLPFNLILAAVAEEEISGPGGISSILGELPTIDLAIIGEPTSLDLAIAEKGLLVIDGKAKGVPGHAAHKDTVNPIYIAAGDTVKISNWHFDRVSPLLGETRASVTLFNAGTQHNQVPAECSFVIDVRVNECYTNEEVFNILQDSLSSHLEARSFRLNSSGVPEGHPILQTAEKLSLKTFGSATLSDQALIPFPSIKIGPGDTLRSHTADEFVYLHEVEEGIKLYTDLLRHYLPL